MLRRALHELFEQQPPLSDRDAGDADAEEQRREVPVQREDQRRVDPHRPNPERRSQPPPARGATAQNPCLKVQVANGHYDPATTFAATRYTVARMQIDPEIRKNVSMTFYEGGHMMYIDRKAHAKLKEDVSNFIRGASNVQ